MNSQWGGYILWILMFYVTCWQNNASKLLLAIMESRHDSENADRILFNIQFKQLVCASRCLFDWISAVFALFIYQLPHTLYILIKLLTFNSSCIILSFLVIFAYWSFSKTVLVLLAGFLAVQLRGFYFAFQVEVWRHLVVSYSETGMLFIVNNVCKRAVG